MKTIKYTVTVQIEVLDMDSVTALLDEAKQLIGVVNNDIHNGKLTHNDGDTVQWNTEVKEVEF